VVAGGSGLPAARRLGRRRLLEPIGEKATAPATMPAKPLLGPAWPAEGPGADLLKQPPSPKASSSPQHRHARHHYHATTLPAKTIIDRRKNPTDPTVLNSPPAAINANASRPASDAYRRSRPRPVAAHIPKPFDTTTNNRSEPRRVLIRASTFDPRQPRGWTETPQWSSWPAPAVPYHRLLPVGGDARSHGRPASRRSCCAFIFVPRANACPSCESSSASKMVRLIRGAQPPHEGAHGAHPRLPHVPSPDLLIDSGRRQTAQLAQASEESSP
jgi:hypothetical protein